jgi:hypothetical protein
VERWGAFRLLATLAAEDHLEYPLTVSHRDKPDFLLRLPGKDVGIEVTQALSKEYAEIDALASHMNKTVWLFADQFTKQVDEAAQEEPKRTAAERRDIIQNPPPGQSGRGDDGGVAEWVDWIMEKIEKKTADFANPEFDKFSENWLLVCDSLLPCAGTAPKRWTDVNVKLTAYFSKEARFDAVFILTSGELAEFARGKRALRPIVDLWRR